MNFLFVGEKVLRSIARDEANKALDSRLPPGILKEMEDGFSDLHRIYDIICGEQYDKLSKHVAALEKSVADILTHLDMKAAPDR